MTRSNLAKLVMNAKTIHTSAVKDARRTDSGLAITFTKTGNDRFYTNLAANAAIHGVIFVNSLPQILNQIRLERNQGSPRRT